MNTKRLILATLTCYVIYQIGGFLIHGLWLDSVYSSLAHVFRPREQMNSMAWILMLTSAVMVIMFCYIFTLGYENRGIGEGVRYGLLTGLFIMTVQSFDAHVVYPLPLSLSTKWFVSGMLLFVIMGIAVSMIYKPADNQA